MQQRFQEQQNDRKFLLATFISEEKHLLSSLNRIFTKFKIEYNKVFIFSDVSQEGKKIITYNVFAKPDRLLDISQVYNTIRINRKKESNTLYTINGLNAIIKKEIGKVDPKYVIKWEDYEDRMIHYDEKKGGLLITPIVLISITDKWFFQKFNRIKKLHEE